MRVLVADPIAQDGLDILRARVSVDVRTGLDEAGLIEVIGGYDALVVRSGTQVTRGAIAAGKRLQVIARAGVGVDNIDVDAATQQGVLVVNAPDGNSIAAAEHTIAMMMALARHIPQADASLRGHKWERGRFVGAEVTDKTLGVVGLGRIGREVAQRGRGLRMRVLAYDPYVSAEHAARLGVEMCGLDELFAQADFITVHVPLTPATRGLIGERELALVKPTARLINCARGWIVNEEALQRALAEGRLAGAALDVFAHEPPFASPPSPPCYSERVEILRFAQNDSEESPSPPSSGDCPLLSDPRVIVTPHLGASTWEAQVAVAVDVARQVVDVLEGRPAAHPVNAPFIPPETQAQLLPFCELAEKLGSAASQLVDRRLSQVRVTYAGQLADMDTDLLRILFIKGLLQEVSDIRITLVNASLVARERGLRVIEEKTADAGHFANLITVSFADNGQERVLSGTIMHGEPYIVRMDRYWLDFAVRGYHLLIYHHDQPGMIGEVGQVTGRADINIAAMSVGRLQPRGEALMVLTLDEYASPEVRAEIEALPSVYTTRMLEL